MKTSKGRPKVLVKRYSVKSRAYWYSKKNLLTEILIIVRANPVKAADSSLAPNCLEQAQELPVTHKQLLQAYFQAKHLRPDTQRSYQSVFSAFEHAIPNSLPDTLTIDQLLHWRQHSLAQGLKAISWNSYMRHLSAVFRFGLARALLQRQDNPFKGLSLSREKRKKKVLASEQIAAIIEEFNALHHLELSGALSGQRAGRICPPWFWQTVFETLYHTGIRRNQLLHLRKMDVDLSKNELHIRLEGSKNHREYDVPINQALHPWLELLISKAEQANISLREQLFNITRFKSGFRKHNQMNGEHLSKGFTDLSKRLGFPVSPHRFRHTLGTNLMHNAKANLHLVKALLGHASLSTTLEYIEPNMEQLHELLNSRAKQDRPDSASQEVTRSSES